MSLFFSHISQFEFLQYAVFAGFFAAIACGVVGSYVVVRRTTYVAGAIAHCVLGGMGAARYLNQVHGVEWLSPIAGATISAIFAALIISQATFSGKQRMDTVLSSIWALGMAVGISFISVTPGYSEDLMSYLFGNILMVGHSDLLYMAILDFIILAIVITYFDRFLIISFQPELARLRGVKVKLYYTILLILIAITVVLLTQVVGLVMVIALLTLPAATALIFANRLWLVMVISSILCFIYIFLGLAISYEPQLPSGATIIELAGIVYLAIISFKTIKKKIKK